MDYCSLEEYQVSYLQRLEAKFNESKDFNEETFKMTELEFYDEILKSHELKQSKDPLIDALLVTPVETIEVDVELVREIVNYIERKELELLPMGHFQDLFTREYGKLTRKLDSTKEESSVLLSDTPDDVIKTLIKANNFDHHNIKVLFAAFQYHYEKGKTWDSILEELINVAGDDGIILSCLYLKSFDFSECEIKESKKILDWKNYDEKYLGTEQKLVEFLAKRNAIGDWLLENYHYQMKSINYSQPTTEFRIENETDRIFPEQNYITPLSEFWGNFLKDNPKNKKQYLDRTSKDYIVVYMDTYLSSDGTVDPNIHPIIQHNLTKGEIMHAFYLFYNAELRQYCSKYPDSYFQLMKACFPELTKHSRKKITKDWSRCSKNFPDIDHPPEQDFDNE
jgi:hypothetical protein